METVNPCPQAPRCERIIAIAQEMEAVGILCAGNTLMTGSMALGRTIVLKGEFDQQMTYVPVAENRCEGCPLNPLEQSSPRA